MFERDVKTLERVVDLMIQMNNDNQYSSNVGCFIASNEANSLIDKFVLKGDVAAKINDNTRNYISRESNISF